MHGIALRALLALTALLGVAASALGLSLPPPTEGDVRGPLLVERTADGGAVVTWSRYDLEAREYRPRAATVEPGGHWAWADPAKVSPDALWTIPEPGRGLAVATDSAGNALAIWRVNDAIRVASRPAGRVYGAATTLSPTSGEGAAELAVGLGAGGHAVALWTVRTAEPDPGYARRTLWAADRAPDGTWSAPYVLAGPDARHGTLLCGGCPDADRQPAVAVDAAGNAVAAWTAHLPEPGGTAILWAARPAGGTWSAPTVLSQPAGPDVQMVMTATGTAVATWMEDGWLHSAVRPPGAGAFGPATHLGKVSGYGSVLSRMRPSLTIDAENRTLAVWTSGNRIFAARSLNAGPWGDPADLSALTEPEPPTPGDPKPPTGDPTPKADLLRDVSLSHARLAAPTCAKGRRPCRAAGVVLGFRLEAAGEVLVTIRRRGKVQVLRAARLTVGAGEHRLRLLTSRPLPAGRYSIKVRATATGWTPDAASRTLVVLGRR